jgi:prevent-host-death family protein
MATDIPHRHLRDKTANLLRRVEAGERLRITVDGHPVAELVTVGQGQPYVPFEDVVRELRGVMEPGERLDRELREVDDVPADPFAR